jgi:hypothetical protein
MCDVWAQERTLKMSAPLSQKDFGSIPAFAAARWTSIKSAHFLNVVLTLHLQPVFVCSCAHNCALPFEHVPTLYNVRKDHSVQVADMRGGIDVEDGRGDVVWFLSSGLRREKPRAATIDLTWLVNPIRTLGQA